MVSCYRSSEEERPNTEMAGFLRDTPIKRKLMLVILLTTGFALLLTGSALTVYELFTFRHSLAANMRVLARIIGSNSTSVLALHDYRTGEQILAALSVEERITRAAIFDRDGKMFVRFPTDRPLSEFPRRLGIEGYRYEPSHLALFQPIMRKGTRIGTIYLQADASEMYSRFAAYGLLLLFVGGCASLGAITLTATLQRRISVPILELAKLATSVSLRPDYSVRAVRHGADEIGQLTDAFNHMLVRIGESSDALAAGEERLRLALEGSRTGTWDWNFSTGRIRWDDYMYPLYGRTRKDFDGTAESFLQIIHPDDRADLERSTQRAIARKEPIDFDFRILDLDGTVRHMASRGRVFYDENDVPLRMSGVNIDITASKQNEEELSRAKEAAEAANQAKDHFLAVLSHELRTPLTPVLATVALLEEDRDTPDHLRREIATIRRNIEVEARLIDDLLDVTGIIQGKLELNRQPADVRALLEHTMQNYCATAAALKNLKISIEVTGKETHVLADSARLTQVFWNLLQNACKFTPAHGRIQVRVYNQPPACAKGQPLSTDIVVEISDTGIGINPEHMPRVFNAFEQGEHARTRIFGGLGLGLAISRAIVELHEGTLTAESAGQNKGAKLIIRLPAMESAAVTLEKSQAPAQTPQTTLSSRSLRVLLVEDHPDSAAQLIRLLERAGHEVTWAGTIREAQEIIAAKGEEDAERGFNILISDLGLPDGSGHDLMRGLANRHHSLPGIALSGYGRKDDILNSMEAGFSRHITKPVDWQELKVAIQNIAVDQNS
ncbi:MAG: ATP-binding protein [Spartobacteria bacterium]